MEGTRNVLLMLILIEIAGHEALSLSAGSSIFFGILLQWNSLNCNIGKPTSIDVLWPVHPHLHSGKATAYFFKARCLFTHNYDI